MLLLRTSRGVDPGIPLLRSLGSNAHVWLPGANGVNVASLPSNNYLLSDGSTGYSTVDGVDGLTLDAMGALSSTELVTNGTFDSGITGWTAGAGAALAVVSGELEVAASGAASATGTQTLTAVIGKTYVVTGSFRAPSANTGSNMSRIRVYDTPALNTLLGSQYVSAENVTQAVFFTFVATATNPAINLDCASSVAWGASGDKAYFDNISVKEYTGTHLAQATTANKPLVRRGVFNELLNSATPATQSVTCIAAPYTLALYGTGNVVLSGTGAGTLTGTGASDLVVLNFTPTAGSVTFTKAGTVSSFGLFKGTWTAAQILAEGGIPTTTATAASNPSAGKYWWSLDGSNDSLLSDNLGITNACTIVVAGRVNSLAAINYLMGEDTNGFNLYVATSGAVGVGKTGVSNFLTSAAGKVVAGVPFVLTFRLSGGTAVIRKDGVQIATVATALVFAAITGLKIGMDFGAALPTNGALGWVVPLPTALSDADCLMVERLVGAQFPGMSTVDGDANSMLLEDGSGFLTMETGDLLLLE